VLAGELERSATLSVETLDPGLFLPIGKLPPFPATRAITFDLVHHRSFSHPWRQRQMRLTGRLPTFDLTGLNLAMASITGAWTSDNDGVAIYLNGVNTGIPATSFTQFPSGFVPFTIGSGFIAGVNTLDLS
jgi:hypothetical protein